MHVQSSNDLTKQWYKIYQYSITISSIILYHITLYYILLYYLMNRSLTIYVKKSCAGLSLHLFHICSMYMYLPLTIYSVMNAQVISESLWCKRKQDVSINIQLEKFICELIKAYLQKAVIILNSWPILAIYVNNKKHSYCTHYFYTHKFIHTFPTIYKDFPPSCISLEYTCTCFYIHLASYTTSNFVF